MFIFKNFYFDILIISIKKLEKTHDGAPSEQTEQATDSPFLNESLRSNIRSAYLEVPYVACLLLERT